MKHNLVGDMVMIKRDKPPKTVGNIYVPKPEKTASGTVISLGKGGQTPFYVKKGDKVYFLKGLGTEIHEGGEDYLILSEKNILCKV